MSAHSGENGAETGGPQKPVILITGAGGNLGRSLAATFADSFTIVGLDLKADEDVDYPILEADLTDDEDVTATMSEVRERYGSRFAAVIHLAAFFDMSGNDHPLYEKLNVGGTRRLLHALGDFEVERFVYASTMLVHQAGRPGERIDEDQLFGPGYIYPQSKLRAEEAIREHHGAIPYAILRLAGVYDRDSMVPTLAHQVARVYEREFKSHFYAGTLLAGQSMLHRDDMLSAFRLTVERRRELPHRTELLIGEPDAIGYDRLQDMIGELVHGEEWETIRLPKSVAAAGAWAEDRLEPVVPDAIDQGERPFIRPWMIRMADDHYALDISRARNLLGWEPRHKLADELPGMIASLREDPAGWYARNGVTPPPWLEEADEATDDPDALRARHDALVFAEHAGNRWAHFVNMGLGTWLLFQPPLIGVDDPWLRRTEVVLGALVIVFAFLSLSWRLQAARWVTAGLGALVMAAPFVFWTENAAAYLSDTLTGALIFGFAVGVRPEPGPSIMARMSGPDLPPGWSFDPSTWTQRLPIIVLAFVGLYVSRYLAGYQLEQIDGVWEPFFEGDPIDPRNGTEEIITSSVSEAWPVSDAAVGAYTYILEILTGIVGSRARWRTMPWLVLLFGLMIVPLGIVSITFIVIQPIIIGTWSTLALLAAAAMLVQIPYSLDELVASIGFLFRRARGGQNVLRVLLFGDTDEGSGKAPEHEFDRSPRAVVMEMVSGGVNLPWTLWLAVIVGIWLMFTRLTFGAEGAMANADHLIGSLVLTVIAISAAEVARAVRFLLVPLGAALFITPFALGASWPHTIGSMIAAAALIALAFKRGRIEQRYGDWQSSIF